MGDFGIDELDTASRPYAVFRDVFGYVPNLFRTQRPLSRALEAEAALVVPMLAEEGALSRAAKERIAMAVAVACRNSYCATLHHQNACLLGLPELQLDQIAAGLRPADLSAADRSLLDFALQFGPAGPAISGNDAVAPRALGWSDAALLDAVLAHAWARFECVLAAGLGPGADLTPLDLPGSPPYEPVGGIDSAARPLAGSWLAQTDFESTRAPWLSVFRQEFGFIPSVLRAQFPRPAAVEAQVTAFRALVFEEGALTRVQKEFILLGVSSANRNRYWVAVLRETLRRQNVPPDAVEAVAADYRQAPLTGANKALLDFSTKLALQPAGFGKEDSEWLARIGFSGRHVMEAAVIVAFAVLLNTLQAGLGVSPDFPAREVDGPGAAKSVHLPAPAVRLSDREADPDAGLVASVQAGDLDAFEVLMNRHSRAVYRTLIGFLENREEAQDAMQDTFLKAFQHIDGFQGRSKFSTWLVSIAHHTGIELVRGRKRLCSIEEDSESGERFRPHELRAWADDPEQLYARSEMRALVEDGVMKLPAKYRVVLLLRDLEQLSMDEMAAVLGFGDSGAEGSLPERETHVAGSAVVPLRYQNQGRRRLISCSDFLAQMGDYLEGEVADVVRIQIESHLAHCRTCQVIYDSSRKTVKIVTESGCFDLPEDVSRPYIVIRPRALT